jgi:DNA primase
MHSTGIVKYEVKLRFEIDGVVERADLIGAIFGQTEGLFGPEMNLNELQKTWKVGRIEINLKSKAGKTQGEVVIPMSTDISTAALIAAAVESVDKVGPCAANFSLVSIDDIRISRRKTIVERAKTIVKEWASKSISESDVFLKDVLDSTKRSKIIVFGEEELPAGIGIHSSDTIILVEGRADVINLLRAGIDNSIAIEGTKIPKTIVELSKTKKMIAFLDGDRGGDLILKELNQVIKLEAAFRAPANKEVEDLTPVEILQILKDETLPTPKEEKPLPIPEGHYEKIREIFPSLNGTLEAVIFDEKFEQISRMPVSELVQRLEGTKGARYVIFDGIITQRLVDLSTKLDIGTVVAHRISDINNKDAKITLLTFSELGLD